MDIIEAITYRDENYRLIKTLGILHIKLMIPIKHMNDHLIR